MASSVNLGSNLDSVVDQLVSVGRYGSRSEVLRAGVRLVQEREQRLAELDAAIIRGIDDARAGRSEAASTVFGQLRRKYEAVATQKNVA